MNWRFALRLRRGKQRRPPSRLRTTPRSCARCRGARSPTRSIPSTSASPGRAGSPSSRDHTADREAVSLALGHCPVLLWQSARRAAAPLQRGAPRGAPAGGVRGSRRQLSQARAALSIRVDVLPYAYCAELSKMLDRVPAFPTSEAIAIIERNLEPLGDVFGSSTPSRSARRRWLASIRRNSRAANASR